MLTLLLLWIMVFAVSASQKMNVVFLVSDDMRPEIGAYRGPDSPSPIHPNMSTPNLDALAARSLLLKRAYVQQAVCSPSRTSFLTGRRPDTTRVHDLYRYFRHVAGNFTTIPQYFKQNGYVTSGAGKVFHYGVASNYDDPISWTEPYFRGTNKYWGTESSYTWCAANEDKIKEHPLVDQQTTQHTLDTITRLAPEAKTGGKPFFVALGLHRPHLPFLVPAHFFNLYPEEDISLPNNPFAPDAMAEFAWSNFGEMRAYADITNKYGYGAINSTYPDDIVRKLRRAYYAAVSFADSLFGQVLDHLDKLGLTESTIVSFTGDHGYQLGEHGEWCKHTNFELATHTPLMIRIPGLTDSGVSTERMVEHVDIFPTLAEAAGLPTIPICPENSSHIQTCAEGVSLLPLVKNPKGDFKSAVFSQYPRMDVGGDTVMGYSVRTLRYRYTEWVIFDTYAYKPRWNSVVHHNIELYDHMVDPEENKNVAHEADYKSPRQELSKILHDGWRKALPKKTAKSHSKEGNNVVNFKIEADSNSKLSHL